VFFQRLAFGEHKKRRGRGHQLHFPGLIFMKGQAGAEFALVLWAVLAVVVAVMLRAYVETELSTAFAAARLGAVDAVAVNSSLSLAAMDYAISGRNVTFLPRIFYHSTPVGESPVIRSMILRKIRDSFSPAAPVPASNFSTMFHDYYVAFP